MAVKAVMMTPGSGGSTDHPTFHQLVAELDIPVRLYDFEYRRQGKKSSGRADRLIPELAAAAGTTAKELGIDLEELAIGGRSMGGRVCSMAVAGGLVTAGLVLLSYPLHPPGKPENLRVGHWPHISCPTLLVSGPRDPFGSEAEFDEHVDSLGGPAKKVWLDSGNHDPRNAAQRGAIVAAVSAWVAEI
jgi:hypothetical protein